jgi:hypothetical protein
VSDEDFKEWLKANYQQAGGAPILAKAAWDAALERAAELIREQAKRYTCATRRGLIFGLADLIKKSG